MAKEDNIIEDVKKAKNNVTNKVKKVKLIDEFKKFIAKGNVLELAVGVIIGASFQNLVTSLTNNIISPILGIFGEVDFSEYVLNIGNLHLKYGAFITDIINFIISAFIIFLIVKFMNKLLIRKKEEQIKEEKNKEPVKSEELKVLEEIRNILKENNNSK